MADAVQYGAANVLPAGGNLGQTAARDGTADSTQYPTAANALPAMPRGGYADYLDNRAAVISAALPARPMGGYAEFLLWSHAPATPSD